MPSDIVPDIANACMKGLVTHLKLPKLISKAITQCFSMISMNTFMKNELLNKNQLRGHTSMATTKITKLHHPQK